MKKKYISPTIECGESVILNSLLDHSFDEVDSKRRGYDVIDEEEILVEEGILFEEDKDTKDGLW